MRTTARPWRRVGALAVMSITMTACTALPGTSTKAGGQPQPVTLTVGTDDPQGAPAANQIEEFARQVEKRSHGGLAIQPRFRAVGEGQTSWDQKVAGLVVAGDLDLGMIPARAWDALGVDTLRALNTPFLVTTDELTNRVVSDPDVATDLMSGLDAAGVTGLALVPEGMRHLFLYGEPQLTVAGLDGAKLRAPRSDTTWAFYEALGAHPDDANLDVTHAAAESSYALAPDTTRKTTAIGNLTLFPKVNTLVVNSDRHQDLSEEQRRVLREAAQATRDWAITANKDDASQATTFCESGGAVVNAADDVVAAFRAAAKPVTAMLRHDARTADLISRIQKMARTTSPSVSGPTCDGTTPMRDEITAETIVPTGGDLPDGTYRAEYTDEYLKDHSLDAEHIASNHGVWTFVLDDGQWSFDQVAPNITDHGEGVYQVDGKHLYWLLPEGNVLHFKWRTDGDGDLHFKQIRDLGADADPAYPYPDFQFDLEWLQVD